MKFSEEQRKAIYTLEPFLFLRACAGSGKTRVIVERAKYLISRGLEHEALLLITFTKKASHEMAHRLNDERFHVYTFHQFCFQRLKNLTDYTYDIYEEDNTLSPYEKLQITNYKNHLFSTKKPKKYDAYEAHLKKHHQKDFDDLLLDYLNITDEKWYQMIFIDEFQDTNELQYRVLKKLIKQETQVFAVGDPNQSIYRFRGSNYRIIERYINDYHAMELYLSTNYRSIKNVIDTANNLIQHNPKRDYLPMIAYQFESEEVKAYGFKDLLHEAKAIFDYIKTLHREDPSHQYCILYRNHERGYEIRRLLIEKDDYHLKFDENIRCMTIHQAKGLEFDVVFVLGFEGGELPMRLDNQINSLEEERRLCYVALTRAKKVLILTYVRNDRFGNLSTPSVFLGESKVKIHRKLPTK